LQISDFLVTDLEEFYSVGDPLKAVVVKADLRKQRVSLGINPSLFPEVATAQASVIRDTI
jgi:ribosomal protein S1